MVDKILPDILRAIVTDMMIIMLIFTMSTPKYKKKIIYISATGILILINLGINLYFYLTGDYSAVVLTDIFMLLLISIVLKPLFKENITQWGFIYITVLNFYAATVFITYYLSDYFPNPHYANVVLRGVCLGMVVILFWKKAGPLYHQVKEYWHVFSILTCALLMNYLYYFLSGNILEMMDNNFMPILLLIFLTIFIYIGIFLSLKIIIQRYENREEYLNMQNERLLLQSTTNEMKHRLSLMDEAVKQMRVIQHDRRHFSATIMELLEQGKTKEALQLIQKQSAALPMSPQKYCDNVEVNAAVSYYVAMANEKGIECAIRLNIPEDINVDSLELAMVISNLMENAIQGVANLSEKRKVKLVVLYTGQLILNIENHYQGIIKMDENGYPISEVENHGLGTQSIVFFAKKWNAELDYVISDNIFKVQMMI